MSFCGSRLHDYRIFAIILCLTALVWFCVSMAEVKTFNYPVRVCLEGVDTARYAIVDQDTVLPLELQSTGFSALVRGLAKNHKVAVAVDSIGPTLCAVATADCIDAVLAQLGFRGVLTASSAKDSLRVRLSERSSRRYRPSLSEVRFSFAVGYGLCGVPSVEPDEVVLYGSEASLSKIEGIEIAPTVIPDVHANSRYLLPLTPVWNDYPDVHPSVQKVCVSVPVSAYTEKSLVLPLTLVGADTSQHVRLYPDKVEATFWVTNKDYIRLSAEHIVAEVRLDPNADQKTLPVVMAQFPSYARVKHVQPSEVHYVVIH